SFVIVTDGGKRISSTESGGKLLVLNFWETACAPCVKELPSLSSFAKKFGPENVVVVAISGDEDTQKYRRFLIEHQVTLESYRDPERKISKSLGTYMFPETYLIREGRIMRKVVGSIDWMTYDMSALLR